MSWDTGNVPDFPLFDGALLPLKERKRMSILEDLGEMLSDLGGTEDLEAYIDALMPLAEAYVPIADGAVEVIFKYTPVLRKLFDALGDYQLERYAVGMNYLVGQGFSRAEAMQVLLANVQNMSNILQNIKLTTSS